MESSGSAKNVSEKFWLSGVATVLSCAMIELQVQANKKRTRPMNKETQKQKNVESVVGMIAFIIGGLMGVLAGVLNVSVGETGLSVAYWFLYAFGCAMFAVKFGLDYSDTKK